MLFKFDREDKRGYINHMKLQCTVKWGNSLINMALYHYTASYGCMLIRKVMNSSLLWELHWYKIYISRTSISNCHPDAVQQCRKLLPIIRFPLNFQKSRVGAEYAAAFWTPDWFRDLFAYYAVQVFNSSMDNGRKFENQLPLNTEQWNQFYFFSKAPGTFLIAI